jgi:hypothetical protein
LKTRAAHTRQQRDINRETARGVRIVGNRAAALYNHYGIKPEHVTPRLKTNVTKIIMNDYVMQMGVNNTNNAAVRRLIYKINGAVPARFHTTKQSRFKKFFRSGNNNHTGFGRGVPNVAMGVGKLVRAFF